MAKQFENVEETVVERRRHKYVTPGRGGDIPQRRYWVFHLTLI